MDNKPQTGSEFEVSAAPRHVVGCTATLCLQPRDATEAGRGGMSVHEESVMFTEQGKKETYLESCKDESQPSTQAMPNTRPTRHEEESGGKASALYLRYVRQPPAVCAAST
jgi:hypothetical protein